jgi:hypothetical protein
MKQPLSLVHRSQTPSFKLPEQNNKQNTVASAKMLPNCIEKKRKLRFLNPPPPPPPPPLAARLSKLLPLAQKLETLENLILKQKQRHLNDHNDQGFHNFTDSKSDCRNTIITATINPPLLLLLLRFWLSNVSDKQKRKISPRVHSFFLHLKMFKTTGWKIPDSEATTTKRQ